MGKTKVIYKILIAFFIIIFVGAVTFIVVTKVKEAKNKANMETIVEEVKEDTATNSGSTDDTTSIDNNENMYQSPIDFAQLQQEQNPDIYAWIKILDTQIDYPILQNTSDDAYYLNHNIDGSSGYPGCIYSEALNKQDFSDPVTVLYGHNMKDGSMFAGIHKYSDKAYLEEHNIITIYTPEREYTYKVFAAYVSDDQHILKTHDFSTSTSFTTYIDGILDKREMTDIIDTSVEVDSNSKILTLSTCVANQATQRFLVQAVLIEE